MITTPTRVVAVGLLLALFAVSALPPPPGARSVASTGAEPGVVMDGAGGTERVIVSLRGEADLRLPPDLPRAQRLERVVRALQRQAETSRAALRPLLQARMDQGKVSRVVPFWIFNGFALVATPDVIDELAGHPDVVRIVPDVTISAPILASARAAVTEPAPNLGLVNAPALWALGFRGEGIVVANMDTGVDLGHPDLGERWRGGANGWFDPYGEHATPADINGHGTATMGVMVGGDAGGTAIGVAPGAQWIAVKIFNDQDKATTVAIHQGFQWLLDPDGDPATPDAPHVVNGSWVLESPGCDLAFQADVRALRAANVLPIFSAGNYGPAGGTSASPANYPGAFAVGATDHADAIYPESSRGPSACDEPPAIYPELVAPGVDILTAGRFGSYVTRSGTSLAAPHVAGGLALLLSAHPGLISAQQEAALIAAAVDLGAGGPDNDYGHGRLDLMAAYLELLPARVHLPLVLR